MAARSRHLTPSNEETATGPYTRWPLGRGLERFYGFLGGDTSQWYPDLVFADHERAVAMLDLALRVWVAIQLADLRVIDRDYRPFRRRGNPGDAGD